MKIRKWIFFLVGILLFLQGRVLLCPIIADASELVQSPETVEIDLLHQHSGEKCYERVWVPCGGHWGTYFEPYVMATVYSCSNAYSNQVVNGVTLSSIHNSWVCNEMLGIHEGDYAASCICTENLMGHFSVTRKETDAGIVLEAVLLDASAQLTEYSITWNRGITQSDENASWIIVPVNGVYTATIEWYDAKEEAWHQAAIDYTELSIPINIHYMVNEVSVSESIIRYGDAVGNVLPPTRSGYDFCGYYYKEQLINNADGSAVNGTFADWEESEVYLESAWKPRHYLIYYGEDLDEDGMLDESQEVIFGEEYQSITCPENRQGFSFRGYYIGNEQIFDSEGQPTNLWKWDLEGELTLVDQWVPIISHTIECETHIEESQVADVVASSVPQETTISEDAVTMEMEDISVNTTDNTTVSIEANEQNDYSENLPETTNETQQDEIEEPIIIESIPQNNIREEISANEIPLLLSPVSPQMNQETLAESHTLLKNVIKVTTITIGSLVAIWGCVWAWLYFFAMASIWSYQISGKQLLLGKQLITSKGPVLQINITKKMLLKCDTNQIQITIPRWFVKMQKNKEILIHVPDRTISEHIKAIMNIKL